MACDRQKSYADLKRKDIEYQVGDKSVFESFSLAESASFWQEREAESTIHWAI